MFSPAYKIETGIPLPPHDRRGGAKKGSHRRPNAPWSALAVGDSFFVPDTHVDLVSAAATAAAARYADRKFACRSENGGVRVWRVS